MDIQENVLLGPLTTLRVGGPARYFVEARNEDDVREALKFARERTLPLFVLGGGSNLVVLDSGWPGLVLKVTIRGFNHRHGHEVAYFDAGAGEDWDGFVAATVAHHCVGIECLSGIPGSVGGTPVQNVGAYGQEVSQTIEAVNAIEVATLESREFDNADCRFNYRTSIFNTSERGKYVIVRVSYALKHGVAPRLEYADLKKHFAGWSEAPSPAQVREAVRKIRASKGMLIVPGDEDCRSAGSFFKNPVVSEEQFADVVKRAAAKNLEVPSYPALERLHKLSAAWLVERSGFAKGYGTGQVGISRKHALAIVNRGGASAAEVLALKDQIQGRVDEIWGIRLEAEPVVVGVG
jgi:UDP-N-acetylmuramate dehydrogenase